jgi:hypothetical protein
LPPDAGRTCRWTRLSAHLNAGATPTVKGADLTSPFTSSSFAPGAETKLPRFQAPSLTSTGRARISALPASKCSSVRSPPPAACPPANEEDWKAWWHHPPPPAELEATFAPLAAAFNLDGDGPRFLQDLEDFPGDSLPIERLLIDAPGENTVERNTDLLVKRDRVALLGRPAAAMALYTLQTFAPSGGAGHRTSLRGKRSCRCAALPLRHSSRKNLEARAMDENKRWPKAEDSSVYAGIRIDYLRRFRGSSKTPHTVLSLGRGCRVPQRTLAECIHE